MINPRQPRLTWGTRSLCRDCSALSGFFAAGVSFAALFLGVFVAQAQNLPHFHVQAKWVIGGLGRWHAMAADPDSKLLYVTRQDRVIAIDTDTGKQVSAIGGFQIALGIALDHSGYGYVTDAGAGSVVVFSRKQNRVIRSMQAGQAPGSIVFEPATGTLWAFDLRGKQAIVIDAKTQGPLGSVPLPGRPGPAASDGEGSVYTALAGKSGNGDVVRIDARKRKVRGTWPLKDCRTPVGLAIDTANKRLFAACGNGFVDVVSMASGKLVARLTVGGDAGDTAFSSASHELYVADGFGALNVIGRKESGKYSVIESIPTVPGARTMALSPDGSHIYIAGAEQVPRLHTRHRIIHPRPAVVPGPFVILVVAKDSR